MKKVHVIVDMTKARVIPAPPGKRLIIRNGRIVAVPVLDTKAIERAKTIELLAEVAALRFRKQLAAR